MTARRTVLALLSALLMTPLGGCGTCLVLLDRPTVLRIADGPALPIVARERQHGLFEMEPDTPLVPALLAGFLFDWIDTFAAPVVATRAMFDDEQMLQGGVFGFLAALTPLASVTRGMQGPIAQPRVSAAELAVLRDAASPERQALLERLFGERVVDIEFR